MRSRIPALLCLALAAAWPARAQQQPKMDEGEIAIAYISGRFAMPVTCKRQDGTTLELQDSIVLKVVPEAGTDTLQVTFFGIEVPDVDYCYNLVERRVADRRGQILLRYRSHNRKDLGSTDFRRTAIKGSLTYNAYEGEVKERPIGSSPEQAPARALAFDGGDSRLVVEPVQPGSDGAKLFADFDARANATVGGPVAGRRYTFRFVAKDGEQFVFYAIEDRRKRK